MTKIAITKVMDLHSMLPAEKSSAGWEVSGNPPILGCWQDSREKERAKVQTFNDHKAERNTHRHRGAERRSSTSLRKWEGN